MQETEGRVYQQVEIEAGPSAAWSSSRGRRRRQAQATYEDGILRVELPVRQRRDARQVPIERSEDDVGDGLGDGSWGPDRGRDARGRGRRDPGLEDAIRRSRCPARSRSCRCADMVTYPDTLTPLAVGQERSIKLVNDVLSGERHAGHGRLRATPSSTSPGPTTSTTSASPASSRGC